jgi:hypothetical protein
MIAEWPALATVPDGLLVVIWLVVKPELGNLVVSRMSIVAE